MTRNKLMARISPKIRLEEIRVKLSDYEPPVIEATGRMMNGNRRADMASTVTIKTGYIGPATADFIKELKQAFSERLAATDEGEK